MRSVGGFSRRLFLSSGKPGRPDSSTENWARMELHGLLWHSGDRGIMHFVLFYWFCSELPRIIG